MNDLLLMPQRSEWSSSRQNTNSCNSLSRMLMRPRLLLFLALFAHVFRTQSRPANPDEGKMVESYSDFISILLFFHILGAVS